MQHPQLVTILVIGLLIFVFLVLLSLGYLGSLRSVVKKRTRESQMNRENLDATQRIAHVGSWEWEIEKDITSWSDELYRIFGMKPQEIAIEYETFMSFVHPDDSKAVRAELLRPFEALRPYGIEYRIVRRDGEIRTVYSRAEVIADVHGQAVRMVGTAQDITKFKLAEEKIVALNETLETRVQERTSELQDAQNELIRKNRLAMIGQLTATVSHEIRNPLGAMRPSLYILKKGLGEDIEGKLLQAHDRIDRNIDRCDRIIDELLDFTRINNLEKQATRIDEWLESVIEEQDIPPDILVKKRYSLKNFCLPVDTDRFRRAIINVVENACQAMQNAKGEARPGSQINIRTGVHDGRVEIAITDTGSGMPADISVKTFEPFFSTKSFGVGLGLPTVKQIVEQHEGGIDIESEEGNGTTVTLWLPVGRFVQ